MAEQILEQLFDSSLRVKLLRLFLSNPGQGFTLSEATRRVKSDRRVCRRQLEKLSNINLLNTQIRKGKKIYSVNPQSDFYSELRTLVLKSIPASKEKILKRLKKLGRVKLAVLSGIFINAENSRADLLIVGDNIKKRRLTQFLKDLEAEAGKEIDYVFLTTDDFKYRYGMFDRFLRDLLEGPHEKLINKLRI